MKKKCKTLLYSLMITLVCAYHALATNEGSQDQQIQTIKQQALELNRDLLLLEEELLFPNDSRLTIFLSVDLGDFFSLQSVDLSIGDRQLMHYQYTPQQMDALRRGGIHRLYVGNVTAEERGIVAVFTGKVPKGLDYRLVTEHSLEKTSGAKNLELKIIGSSDLQQPKFALREW